MQATYIGLYKTSWLVSSVHHSCRVSVSLSFWKAKSHQLIAMGKRYRRARADCIRANRLFHRFRLCFTEFSSDCINLAIETVLIYWLASMQRRGEWGVMYTKPTETSWVWSGNGQNRQPQINFGSTNFTVGSFFPTCMRAPTSHFSPLWALLQRWSMIHCVLFVMYW
jgi:hypothetical protein